MGYTNFGTFEFANSIRAFSAIPPVDNYLLSTGPSTSLGFQLQRLELFPRRPLVAQMINGRPRWRERERIKRFGEHGLQVIPGGDADSDVRIEMLAGCLRNECRDVVDGR